MGETIWAHLTTRPDRTEMLKQIFASPIQLGTAADRRTLLDLANHEDMGPNAQLVYIYTLGVREPQINYPLALGRTVYIGETKRETGAGIRFGGHISTSLTEGLSTLINHTLSVYYYSGRALELRVFRVTDGRTTKKAERVLLRAHLHGFGAYPIAQGASGKNNTPCEVSRLYGEEMELHNECLALLGKNAS